MELCYWVFDGILIYSLTLLNHIHYSLKFSKCSYIQQHIEYLGHIILSHGVAPNVSKIQVMLNLPIPKILKQLSCFLGLAGY